MKKSPLFLSAAAAATLLLAACSSDKGTAVINLPADFQDSTIVVSHALLDNMFSATSADDVVMYYDTLQVKDGVAKLKLDAQGAAWYSVEPPVMTRRMPEFYATADESVTIDINSFEPLEVRYKGTQLMEDITAFNDATIPIQMEYVALVNSIEDPTEEQLAELRPKVKENMDRYDAAVKKFIADNPKSPAVPYALTELSGDDFKTIYDNMTPEAKKSILMSYAESYNKEVEKMMAERNAEEARAAEVASGTIEAPGFTLPDLNGKMVSLSDFRGKWVVLDFWGSWCGWCIKGFPALKEAYNKYGDKLVIIGIDCNEPESDWREGVKKHEIPWLNVYNGMNQKLYEEYEISGFPTKAIINPEGKLVDLTTGEDPSFFTRLANFMK